ncbi:Integrase core domain protein [Candidatus Zixiibacteriota bacterium]|nr:Integrase core domain protein [candidate division Zixibacteria bacterium]
MSRGTWYKPPANRLVWDKEVIAALPRLIETNHRWGFGQCYQQLRFAGCWWNHKRVYRVYTQLGLQHRPKTKKQLPNRDYQPLGAPRVANAVWALDFMSDTLCVGRRFRMFNVLDEGMREVRAIEIDTSLPGKRVMRFPQRLIVWRGVPQAIRCDNGSEFLSWALVDFCRAWGIALRYIQPGKPNQNGYIERFNKTFRNDVLNAYLFEDLDQVREITAGWLRMHNEQRCHDALGGVPPTIFRERQTAINFIFELST